MKTPHTIMLMIQGKLAPQYDPVTDSYVSQQEEWVSVPCLVDVPKDATIIKEYGAKESMDIRARFLQYPPEFEKAKFEGETYVKVDASPSGRKKTIRLRRVTRESII